MSTQLTTWRRLLPGAVILAALVAAGPAVQPQPLHAAPTTTRRGQASLRYVDNQSGVTVARQTLTPGGALRVPSGYVLIDAAVAANIQATIKAGYHTTASLRAARRATTTLQYVTAGGTVVGRSTISGYVGDRRLVTPQAPSGYALLEAGSRELTFPAVSNRLTIRVRSTAAPQAPSQTTARITYRYVVGDGNLDRQIGATTVTGKVGETGRFTAAPPAGYQLAATQASTVAYRLTAAPQTRLIHLVRATGSAAKTTTAKPATKPAGLGCLIITVRTDQGRLLLTLPLYGRIGTRRALDPAAILRRAQAAGATVVQGSLPTLITFTKADQHLTVVVRQAKHRKTKALPRTAGQPDPGQPELADPMVAPAGLPLTPGLTRPQLPPIITSGSRLNPQAIRGASKGGAGWSPLAAYFIALSGKINYGIAAH